jgi:aminopeptidase-like protein
MTSASDSAGGVVRTLGDLRASVDPIAVGAQLHALISELYPICRSITGEGLRRSLSILQRMVDMEVREVPSGTQVFDWTVPKEWNIRDAYVKNLRGERVIDFHESNLHVVSYSGPVHARLGLAELRSHLFTLPEQPEVIPYRTAYYTPQWGFCLSHRQLTALEDHEYEVCIDSALEDGSLTFGECYVPGATDEEVLISCHSCHPSLCNDNLSGMAVATLLASHLSNLSLRYSYRFLFIPGTIGSITWLALNETRTARIRHGLVISNVGDPGPFTYKRSRQGSASIDRAVQQVLAHSGHPWQSRDFSPYGYDERQYCSPGFDLPVGRLSRTPHGEYPQYHTSADDLDFVRPESLAESFAVFLTIFDLLEHDRTYISLNQKCEPQLGRRGLYRGTGGVTSSQPPEMAMLWVLNLADGRSSLLDIAVRSGLSFDAVRDASAALLASGLLVEQP